MELPPLLGIAIGPAVIIDRRKIERYPKIRITEGLIDDEIKRFDESVEASYRQIDEAKKKLESRSSIKEHALILEAHLHDAQGSLTDRQGEEAHPQRAHQCRMGAQNRLERNRGQLCGHRR